jgi:hypothetical protein
MTASPLDTILDRLENVRTMAGGERSARCPAHEDRTNSLSVGTGEGGRVLLKCHTGCTTEAIVGALGLTIADLFPPKETQARRVVAETDYRVCDEHGELHGIHRRIDYSDGDKIVYWLQPDGRTKGLGGRALATMPLYGSERLAAHPDASVVLCEGEKAAQALSDAGYLALGTVTGAAGTPGRDVLAVLQGREVLLWPDNDVPGVSHMMAIWQTLRAFEGTRVRLITWPDAPPKGDAYDYIAYGGDVDLLLDAAVAPAADTKTAANGPTPGRIMLVGNDPLTPPDYLIDGVAPKDSLVSVVGKEASYKSFIAIGMAAAVHTGTPWAGHDAEAAPVLYLAAEGQSGIRRRLRAWEIVNGVSLAGMMLLPEPVRFLDTADVDALYAEIAALPAMPALIVVDTLARNFGGGNENGADDMGRFIAACDRLRSLTSACILIIHHENKLGGYRGSTAFAGAMDTMIEAKREGTAVTLACKKQKDDGEFEPIHLAARVVDLGLCDRHGRAVSSVVLQQTDVSFVLRQREELHGEAALSKNERAALDALRTAPDRKLTYSEWHRTSGLSRNTFDRVRAVLIERGLIRNLGGGGYTPTPEPPPNDPQFSHPHPHVPSTVGVGVTMGVPWENEDADLPEEVGDGHLREEDPDVYCP